jgi:hypothetical protein
MSNPNHKQRRSRTFRVEVLESRELLSTAGIVSRPAAAVAPLERFALSSGIPAVKTVRTIKGSLTGTGDLTYEVGRKSGTVSAMATGNETELGGNATVFLHANFTVEKNGELKYKAVQAAFVNGDGQITSRVTWEPHGEHFQLKGTVESGTGRFEKAKGSFNAGGKLVPSTQTFSITIEIGLTKL